MRYPWISRLLSVFGLAGLILMQGCGGGGGEPGLEPPSSLVASWHPELSNEAMLYWVAPPGAFDGYRLDCLLPAGAEVEGFPMQPPATAVSARLYMDMPSLSEGTDIRFRLCTVKGDKVSAYGNVAALRTGLRPPYLTNLVLTPSGIEVGWTNHTTLAEGIRLERDDGFANLVLVAELPPGATSFLDPNAPEYRQIKYRISCYNGRDVGYVKMGGLGTTINAPRAFTVTPVPGGAHLT